MQICKGCALSSLLEFCFFGVRLGYARFDRDDAIVSFITQCPAFWEGGFPYAADFSTFLVRVGGGDALRCGLATLTSPPSSESVAVAAFVPSLSRYGSFYLMPFTHHVDFTLVLTFGNEGGEYVFEENDG